MTAGKVIAAIAFVVLLAGALTIPLRNPMGTGSRTDQSEARGVVGAAPSSSPSLGPRSLAPETAELQGKLPEQCRRWQLEAPSEGGTIAANHKGRVTLASPNGTLLARVKGRAPVGWSKSGRYLATGSEGNLWNAAGSPVQRHEYQVSLGKRGSTWAWSPVGDCAFVLDRKGHLSVIAVNPGKIPPTYSVSLVDGVESFAGSSDWRWLGLVLRDSARRSIAIADLQRRRVNVIKTYDRATCCITLAGWGGGGESLYFWAGSGNSVMADGWPLQAVSVPRGPVHRLPTAMLPDPSLVGKCAGTSAVVAGGNRDRRTTKRVRFIQGSSIALTPRRLAVSAFTCSPASTLVFSAADDGDEPSERKLYLIELAEEGGSTLLADEPGVADDAPEWAPGTGVLFVRWAGSAGRLWLIPEGGQPRPLPLSVRTDPGAYWSGANWHRVIDWSATPPRGVP